jgi:PAS domain S-box-containing protein
MMSATGTEATRKWNFSLWQRMVLFSVGYFICAEAAGGLSAHNETFISFWMPAGLAMGVLLLSPTRDWPWLLLAILPANFLFDVLQRTKPAAIFFFYCANVAAFFTGAWLVRSFVAERPTFKTVSEFITFVALGAVLNSALGAVIGAATLVHYGYSDSFVLSWKLWWGSDVMAILVLTTFILAWSGSSKPWSGIFDSQKKITEAVLLFIGLGLALWYLQEWDRGVMSPNKSVAIPFILWAGLRFGRLGAATASLFIAIILSFSTAWYYYGHPPGESIFALQSVVAAAVLVSLIPAIVLAERDRTMTRLRESEEHYRNLNEAAFEGICISENGRLLDVNEQFLKMFGYSREEMVGGELVKLVAPESRSLATECIRTGNEEIHELLLLHKDGSLFIAETRARMVRIDGRTVRMNALRDVTARKKVEEALRESEEKFSKAFRTSPDVMSITDLETGHYLEVNDAHEKTFGYKREEVIGHSPTELGIFADLKGREEMVKILKATGRLSNREIQVHAYDGRILTLLHSAELIELGGRQCVLRVSHDITARKCAEEALRESEQRFRSYFELASVGFSITSKETRILAVNNEYCRIMGYSREELLKKTWLEITDPTDLKPNENLFQQTMAGKIDAYTLNKRLVRKDGRVIHCTISARCVRKPDGTPDYFVSLLLDITEREQAIEREQTARAEYTLQLIASQEAERTRIAGELHDSLGQSLSLIKNHAQLLLLEKELAITTRDQIQTISDSTGAAIADLRRISQDLHPYQLDHLGLTGALDALVESAANASTIPFKRKFDNVDDVFPRDGASNLYRIVQEGVNNLLKHSRAQNARVTLERHPEETKLVIEDDGDGFNPEHTDKGMGLKNIAERVRILKGRLKLDSTPRGGTRIEITIPISRLNGAKQLTKA